MTDVPDLFLDKRIVERNIRKGVIGRKDYEKYLKDLPDVEDRGEAVRVARDLASDSED